MPPHLAALKHRRGGLRATMPRKALTRRSGTSKIVDQTLDSSLMKRYASLDEQVGAILFLASDEASYITGVTLPVGGGDLG